MTGLQDKAATPILLGMVNIRSSAPQSMAPAGLSVSNLSVAFGDRPVLQNVSLEIAAGEIVALLGPSGCGKTTLLRSMAGLERPTQGVITLGDRTLTDPKTFVAPERRRIGMVFQDGSLFPHLTVAQNVAYGLHHKDNKETRTREALALVGLSDLADRQPGTLSGGQQQRVAVARALAPEPRVLLLDEPFSSLDTTLRHSVRNEIHSLLVSLGITTVFVTHDQEEAFILGDRVAVLHDGEMAQVGTPAELYRQPVNRWLTTFVGEANLLSVDEAPADCVTEIGPIPVTTPIAGPAELMLRPEDLKVASGTGATVEFVEYYGHDAMVQILLASGTSVRVRTHAEESFTRGDEVAVSYCGPGATAFPVGLPNGDC
jgi:iron(III) transport system ATP-binding protein